MAHIVIPGLINLHAHIGNTVDLVQDKKFHTRDSVEKDLRTYASYGVTTVMSMGTDQDTIFPVRNDQRLLPRQAEWMAVSGDGARLHSRPGSDVQRRLRRAGRSQRSASPRRRRPRRT